MEDDEDEGWEGREEWKRSRESARPDGRKGGGAEEGGKYRHAGQVESVSLLDESEKTYLRDLSNRYRLRVTIIAALIATQ